MFDPILVPLDGSSLAECVLPHVVAIARPFEAKVTLFRVVEQDQATQSIDPLNWQINKTEAGLYLDNISTQLQQAGLRTETMIQEGLAAERIIGFAQAQNVNLIILSSHGRSGLSPWGLSSVVQKVILSAPTSALIVRAQAPTHDLTAERYKRILVALDGSLRAESVLPIVIPLARFHQAQIRVVHVVRKPEMARRTPLTQEDIDLAQRVVERNREEATHYLEQLRGWLPVEGITLESHVLTGDDPAATLHDFVKREAIDLVALSAHGYSGNSQWPYGSMVNNFIFYSQAPLLVVQDFPSSKEEPTQADVAVRERPGY